jgi:hypothetical protein
MTSGRHISIGPKHQMFTVSVSYLISFIFPLRPLACIMYAIQSNPRRLSFQETLDASQVRESGLSLSLPQS